MAGAKKEKKIVDTIVALPGYLFPFSSFIHFSPSVGTPSCHGTHLALAGTLTVQLPEISSPERTFLHCSCNLFFISPLFLLFFFLKNECLFFLLRPVTLTKTDCLLPRTRYYKTSFPKGFSELSSANIYRYTYAYGGI